MISLFKQLSLIFLSNSFYDIVMAAIIGYSFCRTKN